MANAKEIRAKIKSIKSTQKITKAMEMVAASKMKKAQNRMFASRPFAQRIEEVIAHVSSGNLEYQHPFMLAPSTIKKVGYIIVSTDRGLCGGLNINMFKKVIVNLKMQQDSGCDVALGIIGKKGNAFFKKTGCEISTYTFGLGDAPMLKGLLGVINVFTSMFKSKGVDEVYLAHNRFINTMQQEPRLTKLLPIEKPARKNLENNYEWDYIYEPEPEVLLDKLLHSYIESMVYQAVVESIACEQAARMVAMKSASDNASDLIDEFQLMYNKARQSAITQELSEIVAGAAAV